MLITAETIHECLAPQHENEALKDYATRIWNSASAFLYNKAFAEAVKRLTPDDDNWLWGFVDLYPLSWKRLKPGV